MLNGSLFWGEEIFLATDVSRQAAIARGIELQQRLEASSHPVLRRTGTKAKAKTLFREIQSYLLNASDQKLIQEPPHEIYSQLRLTPLKDGLFDLSVGDTRNFKRDPQLPHFTRQDGGWFDFQLLIRETSAGLEILAYDFELRLLDHSQISFVRFDVNPPDHQNEAKALRAHLHLNVDDDGMAVPAPLLSPFEVFDLFIHGIRSMGRIRRVDRPLS